MPQDPRPWGEIAKGFDAQMPAETYDLARRQYFDNVVRPRLSKQDNHLAAWTEFESLTRRPGLSKTESLALSGAMAVTGVAKGMTTPLVRSVFSKDPDAQRSLRTVEKFDKDLRAMAGRYGKSTAPAGLGELAGSIPPFVGVAALTEGTGLPMLAESAWIQRVLRGSLSLGTFEAVSAKDGERLTMGAKGAAMGAAF